MKQNRSSLVFYEMALLIGSVPVFRGLWLFCDTVEFLNSPKGVFLSFCIGALICVAALFALNSERSSSDAEQD